MKSPLHKERINDSEATGHNELNVSQNFSQKLLKVIEETESKLQSGMHTWFGTTEWVIETNKQ